MTRKALDDHNFEVIKAHILNPDDSKLPRELQEKLDRIVSVSKVLDKNPVLKQAVAIHKSKYPNITERTAYNDIFFARKIYNSLHQFDFDFWQPWLINDIISNIQKCRDTGTPQDRRIISMEHANLLKAIGEKPEELPDPKRNEKHQFYIMVNINNESYRIDLKNLDKLPKETLRELNKAISAGKEIDDQQAIEIMNS